jgi:hypothetical protein
LLKAKGRSSKIHTIVHTKWVSHAQTSLQNWALLESLDLWCQHTYFW